MADHPLRPATDRSLGEPLPHQLANRTRAPLGAAAFKNRPPFLAGTEGPASSCGISSGFPKLFPSPRQVTHVLLTRSPLYSRPEGHFRARLACIRHAASVHSEPGSNSPVESCMRPAPVTKSRKPSAVTSALVASGSEFRSARLVLVGHHLRRPPWPPGNRRGLLPLFSFQRTGHCRPRAPWAEPRQAPPAATCPRHAMDLPSAIR